MNLSQLLADRATRHGDKEFLLFERQPLETGARDSLRRVLSYRDLDAQVNRACHFLADQGLGQGDVVNLHLPNCPAFVILWFAAARLGAVMMPTNVLASVDELVYLLGHSHSKIALTTAEHLATLGECQRQLDQLRQVIACDPYASEPAADPDSDAMIDEILTEPVSGPTPAPPDSPRQEAPQAEDPSAPPAPRPRFRVIRPSK